MGRSRAIVLHSQQQREAKRASDVACKPSNLRIRRALLVGKRGPTTPVPSWKLYENPSYDGISGGPSRHSTGRQISISARKLAATLWELQELPLRPPPKHTSARHSHEQASSPKHLMLPPPSPTTPVPQHCTKTSSNNKSSDSNRKSSYSRELESLGEQHVLGQDSRDFYTGETPRQSFEMELQKQIIETGHASLDAVAPSSELMKVLSHIRGIDGNNNSSSNTSQLVAILRVELEHARARVRELEHVNKSAHREIENLLERSTTEKSSWRAKEQEKMRAAVMVLKQEMEDEKKHKHKVEQINRKLSRELEEVNASLARAMKELERERKARQLMEDVCDELAREIGQDKAEVEELKRESLRAKEEIEEERRMLQIAEVWREERVQMKFAEARHELEEKNSLLDRLTSELDNFLRHTHRHSSHQLKASDVLRKATMLKAAAESVRGTVERGGDNGSSAEDDLHSIDLNKESLYDRTQGNRWNQQEIVEWKGVSSSGKPKRMLRKPRRFRRSREQEEKESDCSGSERDGKRGEPSYRKSIPGDGDDNGAGAGDGDDDDDGAGDGDGDGGKPATTSANDLSIIREETNSRVTGSFRNKLDSSLLRQNIPMGSREYISRSSAAAAATSPQRNSWSAGDCSKQKARVSLRNHYEHQNQHQRDNSLRAKLLEEGQQ